MCAFLYLSILGLSGLTWLWEPGVWDPDALRKTLGVVSSQLCAAAPLGKWSHTIYQFVSIYNNFMQFIKKPYQFIWICRYNLYEYQFVWITIDINLYTKYDLWPTTWYHLQPHYNMRSTRLLRSFVNSNYHFRENCTS